MICILRGPVIAFTHGLKGTYILFTFLRDRIDVKIRDRKVTISTGYYVYIGSAFGAGGLASRLHRHLRKKKKRYWHIDQITTSEFCEIQSIGIIIDKKMECEVSEKISKIGIIELINGFGNSDCNSCQSHLYKLP